MDAIGALLLSFCEAKVPVFEFTGLTIELAKLFVKEMTTIRRFNDFHVIDEDAEIWKLWRGLWDTSSRLTHSIPESLGIVLKTTEGSIVYTGTSSLTRQLANPHATDLLVWQEIGRDGVLALLSDSANADGNIRWWASEVGDDADHCRHRKVIIVATVPATFLVSTKFLCCSILESPRVFWLDLILKISSACDSTQKLSLAMRISWLNQKCLVFEDMSWLSLRLGMVSLSMDFRKISG